MLDMISGRNEQKGNSGFTGLGMGEDKEQGGCHFLPSFFTNQCLLASAEQAFFPK